MYIVLQYLLKPILDGLVETEDILLRRLDLLMMPTEILMPNVIGIHLF